MKTLNKETIIKKSEESKDFRNIKGKTEALKKEKNLTFVGFFGDRYDDEFHRTFSNFYPVKIEANTHAGLKTFTSSEQLFMYYKALFFKDTEMMEKILTKQPNPSIYKGFGRRVKPFDPKEWNEVRDFLMDVVVFKKFNQNPKCKERLMQTENAILVECSPYDKAWGIGLAKYDKMGNEIHEWKDINNWRGSNLLGFSLMRVRDAMKEQEQ